MVPPASLEAIIATAIQQGLVQGLQQCLLQPSPQYAPDQMRPLQSQEDISEEQHYSPEHSEHGSIS